MVNRCLSGCMPVTHTVIPMDFHCFELYWFNFQVASANKDIPILLCHGDSDPLVSPDIGKLTKEKMGAFVPNITAKIYRGLGHSSSPQVSLPNFRFLNVMLVDTRSGFCLICSLRCRKWEMSSRLLHSVYLITFRNTKWQRKNFWWWILHVTRKPNSMFSLTETFDMLSVSWNLLPHMEEGMEVFASRLQEIVSWIRD